MAPELEDSSTRICLVVFFNTGLSNFQIIHCRNFSLRALHISYACNVYYVKFLSKNKVIYYLEI